MNAADQFARLDGDIATEFEALHRSIADDYRDLESQSFGLVITAVTQADREPPTDMRLAAIIIIATLAAWALMVGDIVAAFLFGLITAAFAALREEA